MRRRTWTRAKPSSEPIFKEQAEQKELAKETKKEPELDNIQGTIIQSKSSEGTVSRKKMRLTV